MGINDEIFEVKVFAPGEVGGEVESGDDLGLGCEIGELIAPGFLLPDLRDEVGELQVRAELEQHWQTSEDVGGGLGEGNHGGPAGWEVCSF
jgi:hypothetical protein